MKLYGVGLSRSFRPLWALEELGLEYDYIDIKFGSTEDSGSKSEEYKNLNHQGKVPTLVVDDFVLSESGAILNYLATNNMSKELIPKDGTRSRAIYDQFCYFILTEFEQPLWTHGKHSFALPKEYRVQELLKSTTAYEFDKAQRTLVHMLGGSDYAVGNSFTMADVLIGHTLVWAENFDFSVNDALLKYKESVTSRSTYIRALDKINLVNKVKA